MLFSAPQERHPVPPATPRVLGLVVALGVTQIIGFGTLFYAFSVIVVPLSADLSLSLPMAYGALSAALLVSGVVAPLAGRLIDRHGARAMMAAGSVASGVAFALLAGVWNGPTLLVALAVAELFAPLVLYDAAFAALAQSVGPARARRAITQMTLMGGFASTVFWPLTLGLVQGFGWREAYLTFAALHLLICLPLHLSLPRMTRAARPAPADVPPFPTLPSGAQRHAMILLAVGFSLSWAVMSAFSAQWVPVLGAIGLSEGAAVAAGALMGPAQVGARVLEMLFAARRHPMITALVAMSCLVVAVLVLALAPASFLTAAVFAVLFGIGQGLGTVIRGTVPLALFGDTGFAARLGRLASLRQILGAVSPFAMAGALAIWGAGITLSLAAGFAAAALLAFWRVPWRGPR